MRAELIRWYDAEARDLPWRRTRDPYAIWISEVMLQQTRVETVIGYYERFLARLPDVAALAAASEDEVLSLWSGLGYYRRARQLRSAAREIMERHGGRFPAQVEARRALTGVGPYTAGAIGSIAFDRPEPIVDGNVARVLSRFHGIAAPLGTKESESALWKRAAQWVEGPRPGALNQALMELGAMICTPKAPRCERCPLAKRCVAQREDRALELPAPRVRRPPKPIGVVAVCAMGNTGTLFLVKGQRALFGGLYGLPFVELPRSASAKERREAAGAALIEAGLKAKTAPVRRGALVHVLTHRRLHVTLFTATVEKKRGSSARALAPSALADVGLSTLSKRLLSLASSELA